MPHGMSRLSLYHLWNFSNGTLDYSSGCIKLVTHPRQYRRGISYRSLYGEWNWFQRVNFCRKITYVSIVLPLHMRGICRSLAMEWNMRQKKTYNLGIVSPRGVLVSEKSCSMIDFVSTVIVLRMHPIPEIGWRWSHTNLWKIECVIELFFPDRLN